MFNVKVFQIGGNRNDELLVEATGPYEAKLALFRAKSAGASGVSLHGTLPHCVEQVSGEFTLVQAMNEFCRAETALNEQRRQETVQRHLQRHGLA